jgi:hypothetical protein
MSASSRPVQATPGMGQLAAVFAALLAGTALIVALAFGQLTASQGSLAPAAAPAPAANHDHGWSSAVSTTPATHDHGWSSSALGAAPVGRDSGWIDTTPIRPAPRDSGWIDTTPIRPAAGENAFDKAHAPGAASQGSDGNGGSNRVRFAE